MEKGPSPAIQACSRSSLLCSQQLVPHRGGAEQDGSKAKRQQPGQDTLQGWHHVLQQFLG